MGAPQRQRPTPADVLAIGAAYVAAFAAIATPVVLCGLIGGGAL